jgi:hypothetical protein
LQTIAKNKKEKKLKVIKKYQYIKKENIEKLSNEI